MASRRPNGSSPIPIRSIRVPHEIWDPAKARADEEGETMSAVLNQLLDGYGRRHRRQHERIAS